MQGTRSRQYLLKVAAVGTVVGCAASPLVACGGADGGGPDRFGAGDAASDRIVPSDGAHDGPIVPADGSVGLPPDAGDDAGTATSGTIGNPPDAGTIGVPPDAGDDGGAEAGGEAGTDGG